MKLKKIASMMLAGVMAVSMLAGCSGNTIGDNTNGDDNTNTTPAATYSSTFAAALKDQAAVEGKITMADNAELTADLNKAIEKLTAASIMRFYADYQETNITYNRVAVDIAGAKATSGNGDLAAIVKDMDAKAVNTAFGSTKGMLADDAVANKPWEDKTVTMLFAVDSTVSANAAVAEVADALNNNIANLKINNAKDTVAVGDDDVNELHYSYTGSVSVATKTLTENHGMGMHIVAVQITRSAHA